MTDARQLLLPRRLFLAGDGRYRADGQWWVVWTLNRVIADNRRAWHDQTLRDTLVAFGDDGTGNPFCVATTGGPVVRWSWIDNDIEQTEGSMHDFLSTWAT